MAKIVRHTLTDIQGKTLALTSWYCCTINCNKWIQTDNGEHRLWQINRIGNMKMYHHSCFSYIIRWLITKINLSEFTLLLYISLCFFWHCVINRQSPHQWLSETCAANARAQWYVQSIQQAFCYHCMLFFFICLTSCSVFFQYKSLHIYSLPNMFQQHGWWANWSENVLSCIQG